MNPARTAGCLDYIHCLFHYTPFSTLIYLSLPTLSISPLPSPPSPPSHPLMQGVPELTEHFTDSKKEVDFKLKTACEEFILHVTNLLCAPLTAFLAKVDNSPETWAIPAMK